MVNLKEEIEKHLASKNSMKNKVLVNQKGEIRAENYQVVCPPSIHPSGKPYKIHIDKPIRKVSESFILDILKPYLRKEDVEKPSIEQITKDLIEGKKDTSRSGREYREVCKLIGQGKTKEEVFKEMEAFTKWTAAPEQYKEKTYSKAFNYIKSKGLDNSNEYKKSLLAREKPEFKSLGAGIHENEDGEPFMYFGTKVYKNVRGVDAIITSDKKILIDLYDADSGEGTNEIYSVGIKYRYPFIDSVLDYSWSNNSTPYSITAYLYEEPKGISLRECYEDILKNNKAYMDYPEDIIHTSVACDILSSFFLPCYEAKGRAFYNAEKGSGKTRQATLYDLQMFNPIMSADMSGASYYRIIEGTSASIIIDDFDAIEDEKKQSQIQIMRTGYKKGQKTIRTENKGGLVPSAFGIFNSMVINNVGGLDDITQDRCNTYYLIKTVNKKKADRKFDEKNIKWKIQRDKCYYAALLHWKEVKSVYENLEAEGVSGRDLERVAPILTIGKLVLDAEKYKELCEYELGRITEGRIKDVSDDWLFKAIKEVVQRIVMQGGKSVGIRLDELVMVVNPPDKRWVQYSNNTGEYIDNITPQYKKDKHSISVYLGKIFKNTPLFKSSVIHGGYVKYTFEPANVRKFLEIRGYLNFFNEEELSFLPEQPNQSIQSNQPNLPIQPIHNDGEVGEGGEVGDRVRSDKTNKHSFDDFKLKVEVEKIKC